jgi:hypothetical protein
MAAQNDTLIIAKSTICSDLISKNQDKSTKKSHTLAKKACGAFIWTDLDIQQCKKRSKIMLKNFNSDIKGDFVQ